MMRLEPRDSRAFFLSGSRVGCTEARDNAGVFARDTRATTEIHRMTTRGQTLSSIALQWIILAGWYVISTD